MKPTNCPYIGLNEDPETHLAFPSIRNCCHRAYPIQPVSLGHQSSHCLCENYVKCDVITSSIITSLPVEIKYSTSFPKGKPIGLSLMVGLGVCLLVIIVSVIMWWTEGVGTRSVTTFTHTPVVMEPTFTTSFQPTSNVAIPNIMVRPIETPTHISVDTPIFFSTATQATSSLVVYTLVINSTSTMVPSATISVCSPPSGWTIYIVQVNDSLFSIGIRYGITVGELQNANCLGTTELIYAGQALYVPNMPTITFTTSPSATPIFTETQVEITDTPTLTMITTPTQTYTPTISPFPLVTPSPTYPPISTNTLTPPPTEGGR